MLKNTVERKLELAGALLRRLDAGERLSSMLPAIKTLSELESDDVTSALLDIMNYGIGSPLWRSSKPGSVQQAAALKWPSFASIPDIDSITLYNLERGRDQRDERTKVIPISVYEMEELTPPLKPNLSYTDEVLDRYLQHYTYYKEARATLQKIRAYLYSYVSSRWLEYCKEKERLNLIGPDFHIVAASLVALDSEVGNELTATLDRLGSTNPANWS